MGAEAFAVAFVAISLHGCDPMRQFCPAVNPAPSPVVIDTLVGMGPVLGLGIDSPLVISVFLMCVVVYFVNLKVYPKLVEEYFSWDARPNPLSPLTYVRIFTRCLGHQDLDHLKVNLMQFLLVGPVCERVFTTYGLLRTGLIVNVVICMLLCIFGSKGNRSCGLSGIVFALIMMSALANFRSWNEGIPITSLLVFGMHVTHEFASLRKSDGVGHIAHATGAVAGAICGLAMKIAQNKKWSIMVMFGLKSTPLIDQMLLNLGRLLLDGKM